jgi:uncharacterized Zn finger protein
MKFKSESKSAVPFEKGHLFIYCTCPHCGREIKHEVSRYDFSNSSSECDLCGSHTTLSIDFRCPDCKECIELIIEDN